MSKDLLPYLPIFLAAKIWTPALKFPYTAASQYDKRYNWASNIREAEFTADGKQHTAKVTVENGFEKVPREVVEACVLNEYGNPTARAQLGVASIVYDSYNYTRKDVLPEWSILEVSVSGHQFLL
jgi:hypothetical protein